MEKIILASQSPRRRQLLEWAEVDFEVIVSKADESFPSSLRPQEAAIHIASEKCRAVRDITRRNRLILAADTLVILDDEIIGKPLNREDAIGILSRLSGKKHLVITGVILEKAEKTMAFADLTEVWFHELAREQISFYVDKYQPYDKAGAYAIQEWIGVVGIRSIDGDFYNVMGLPVSKVVQALETWQ